MDIKTEGEFIIVAAAEHFRKVQAQKISELIHSKIDEGNSKFILDASNMEFIDSMGIGLLVNILKELKAKDGTIRIRNLTGEPYDLFVDTGLDDIFTIEKEGSEPEEEHHFFENIEDLAMNLECEKVGDISVFRFSGLLDGSDAILKFKAEALLALESNKKFLLDFVDLTYLDDHSTREIENICKLLKTSDGEMRISNAEWLLENIVDRLNNQIPVSTYANFQEALAGW